MPDRWINLVATCIVPLSCPIDSTDEEQTDAAEPILSCLMKCDKNMVIDFHTDLVEDGEPVQPGANSVQEGK